MSEDSAIMKNQRIIPSDGNKNRLELVNLTVKNEKGSKDDKVEILKERKKVYSFLTGCKVMLFGSKLNVLLLATPIAFLSYGLNWNATVTFTFSLLAIAPFAERLGFVTEQLAIHTNDTVGGLLNATFGNATELIVSITALFNGLYRLVQLSLLGSILSNLLLVLGSSFLAGGLKYKEQKFTKISSHVNATLLMCSCMALLFPTILTNANQETHLEEIGFSRATSIVLFVLYFLFLYFQLFTHKEAYDAETEITEKVPLLSNENKPKNEAIEYLKEDVENPAENISILTHTETSVNSTEISASRKGSIAVEVEEKEEDEDILGFNYSLVWLAIITVFIAFLSDALVASIQNASSGGSVSSVFLSTIVIPIIGNAAEHTSAIVFAMKNRLDISLGIAVGSSTQIALMVLPFTVIVGWCGNLEMSLNFHAYEAFSLFLTVIIMTIALKDGVSNWLIGITLLFAYFIIAFGFFAHVDESLGSD